MIRVGTDCSGIEAPIQALKNIVLKYKTNLKIKHVFSSEINKYSRASLLANYNPEILFEDMTVPRKLPKIDIYVCGFPCQPFSLCGNREGMQDSRSNIFLFCYETIKKTEPSLFILENVKRIKYIDNGMYLESIKNKLSSLKKYEIHYLFLNTRDYGIPQNRERAYIVGIKKENIIKKFMEPAKIICRNINNYIDKNDKEMEPVPDFAKYFIKKQKGVFVDLSFLKYINPESYQNYSPTITTSCNIWCVPMHRKANIKELLNLQGFPVNFKQVVSKSQLIKQIGNSMSINVLECLFITCFETLGWL